MKVTRSGKRRAAAINSVKILLTSASLAATLGGWAAISAANDTGASTAASTNTVQVALVTSPTPTSGSSTATQASTGAAATSIQVATTASTAASTATVAPTAIAVPTQVVIQPNIHTRSSK